MSIDGILNEFSDVCPDESLSRGATAKYVKKYDNLLESIKQGYAPFEWHKPEWYGIPTEANGFLLNMWAFSLEHGTDRELPPASQDGYLLPTVRQVRWWWRVHLAAPDAPLIVILTNATELAERELLEQLGYGIRATHDIWAYLAFCAWAGPGDRKHEMAVKQGAIDAWSILSDRQASLLKQSVTENQELNAVSEVAGRSYNQVNPQPTPYLDQLAQLLVEELSPDKHLKDNQEYS
jgi:hypothetical protein